MSRDYITLYIHGEIEKTENKNTKITITKSEAVRLAYQLINVILVDLKRELHDSLPTVTLLSDAKERKDISRD